MPEIEKDQPLVFDFDPTTALSVKKRNWRNVGMFIAKPHKYNTEKVCTPQLQPETNPKCSIVKYCIAYQSVKLITLKILISLQILMDRVGEPSLCFSSFSTTSLPLS
jgi:hypothetical protein